MKRFGLLLLVGCSSWRQESSRLGGTIRIDERGFRGLEVPAAAQINGVGIRLAVDGQFLERDEETMVTVHRRAFGAGVGLGLSVSPLGLLATNDQFTSWFDVGFAGSVGGGLIYPGRLTTYAQAWGGAWATLGLPALGFSDRRVYPTLVVELRREAIIEWDNATVFAVGLALTARHRSSMPYLGPR